MPDMPDWVHVWFWMRFLRAPQVMTPFPQQEYHPDAMTMDEYEDFANEWVQSGAPLTTPKQVVLAMGGSVADDEEIPF